MLAKCFKVIRKSKIQSNNMAQHTHTQPRGPHAKELEWARVVGELYVESVE